MYMYNGVKAYKYFLLFCLLLFSFLVYNRKPNQTFNFPKFTKQEAIFYNLFVRH